MYPPLVPGPGNTDHLTLMRTLAHPSDRAARTAYQRWTDRQQALASLGPGLGRRRSAVRPRTRGLIDRLRSAVLGLRGHRTAGRSSGPAPRPATGART